jgi:hypothetical protein
MRNINSKNERPPSEAPRAGSSPANPTLQLDELFVSRRSAEHSPGIPEVLANVEPDSYLSQRRVSLVDPPMPGLSGRLTPAPILPPARQPSPSLVGAARPSTSNFLDPALQGILSNIDTAYRTTDLPVPVASAIKSLCEVEKAWTAATRFPNTWNAERLQTIKDRSDDALRDFQAAIDHLVLNGDVTHANISLSVLTYFFNLVKHAIPSNIDHLGSVNFSNCKLSRDLLLHMQRHPEKTGEPQADLKLSSQISYPERIAQLQVHLQKLCESLPEALWQNRASLSALHKFAWLGISQDDYQLLKIAEHLEENGDKRLKGHEVRAFNSTINNFGSKTYSAQPSQSWTALEEDARALAAVSFKRQTEIPETFQALLVATLSLVATQAALDSACAMGASVLCNGKGAAFAAAALNLASLLPDALMAASPLERDAVSAKLLESEAFTHRAGLDGQVPIDVLSLRQQASSVGHDLSTKLTDSSREAVDEVRKINLKAATAGAGTVKKLFAAAASGAAAAWANSVRINACISVSTAQACIASAPSTAAAAACGHGAVSLGYGIRSITEASITEWGRPNNGTASQDASARKQD